MLNPWIWLIGGLFICAAEMLLPGAFLLWVGLAAIFSGAILLLVAEGTFTAAGVLVLFAVLAVLCSALGRVVYGSWQKVAHPNNLGQRLNALIGQSYHLESPIIQGQGRIKVQDTVWNVRGPELPAGTRVRVVGLDGTSLKVEPDQA